MIIWAVKTKHPKTKIIISNLVAIPLVLFVTEFFCLILNANAYQNTEHITKEPQKRVYLTKDLYFAPIPNTKVHAISKFQNKKVYDVYYTINKDGLRETATSNKQSNQCLLFFGCSFNFGEGLNDSETLPYIVGEKTHHKYKIYNFAYPAYGASQMLTRMEDGFVDKRISGCKNTIVIYDGMLDHIRRLFDREYWFTNKPKWIEKQNRIFGKILKKTQTYLIISNTNDYYLRQLNNKKERTKYENLYIDTLKKSRELAFKKYNANRFIILFWDYNDTAGLKDYDYAKVFKENSFEYYLMFKTLPQLWQQKYFIRYNKHPSRQANEVVADFLIKTLNSENNLSLKQIYIDK